jgi:STE24 endopeptidase
MNEDKATRYQRLKRRAEILELAWSAAVLGGLVWTGASATLRTASESAVAWAGPSIRVTLTIIAFVIGLTIASEAGRFPIALYSGFLLERRYGLSSQPFGNWLKDQAKSLGLSVLLGAAAASMTYFFIQRSPEGWWLRVGVVFVVLIVGLTHVAPVVLIPLFYRVRPLDRDPLRSRLLALANRAGARVLGAYEWGLSEKTSKANAALAGLGRTRRILVSDTMLAEYSDEEIEVVLAHELAHHVHGHIWKGLAFEAALVMAGCWVASRILAASVQPLGFRGPDDVAALPLLLLAAGAVSLVMLPVAHALSRTYERSADRFALQLTGNPSAFISAMRRLGTQNLAEEHPSKAIEWLFYSHPPIRERIETAKAFRSAVAPS